MRSSASAVSICLVASAACLQHPAEVAHPQPADIVLQVTTLGGCLPDTPCDGRNASVRRGRLVFVDGDSVVMADVAADEQVVVREGPEVSLAIYRGQKMTSGAIAKNAGKGALIGGLVAFAATAATAAITQNFYPDLDVDVGKSALEGGAHGVLWGAVIGGAKGATNGEPAWQRITLLQLRQKLCRCARPDSTRGVPIVARKD
jgi:hypothetical protein